LGGENLTKEMTVFEMWGEHDFGNAISNLGDINNDSLADFMIYAGGDPLIGDPPQIAVNIYEGSTTIDIIPDIIFSDQRGYCSQLAGPGDVNGDGYNDIIFGDVNYAEKGRVRIFSIQPISGIDRSNNTFNPDFFELEQNYPNPFNSTTTIYYDLLSSCFVTLKIFNSTGEMVIAIRKLLFLK
jgi:hypothetical protein